jgi:NSS family neurotransmitter:Na+ symporter
LPAPHFRLGNLWRFPFIAGQNGGAGFVLLYLGFVFFLGLPVMIGEMILGRRGQQSAVGTMNTLVRRDKHSPFWKSIGWLSILLPFLGLTYYSVVAAWALDYLGLSRILPCRSVNRFDSWRCTACSF